MVFGPVVQKEMSFKDFSHLELRQPHCSADQNHLCDYSEFGPVVQEEMPSKDVFYLDIWQPFCSAECNHLCNFGRGYFEDQFCVTILNLGQRFWRRCCLKDFLSGALAALLFSVAQPYMQF